MDSLYISIVATVITFLSLFRIFKSISFKEIITLYTVVNFPIIFLVYGKQEIYLIAYITTILLFLTIRRFINQTYHTDSFLGLEGLVLMSPKLSLFLRLNLLMIANFPPFLNFGVVFESILYYEISIQTVYLLLVLTFNSIIFSKLTNKMLFGRPNKNLIYKDICFKEVALMGFLSLLNLIYGIYYLLNI